MDTNQTENINEQLRDIKPLLEIPDSSYYIYWGLISFAIFLAVAILFFITKKLWDNRKVNLAKGYLEAIKKIDWIDTKQSAYEATYYARLLATDERRKELFSQLEPMLEQYKYKKEVEAVDQDTRNKFNLYVQVADESV
jgi:F0F1-type ATP synthase membrane subunit b/b'